MSSSDSSAGSSFFSSSLEAVAGAVLESIAGAATAATANF